VQEPSTPPATVPPEVIAEPEKPPTTETPAQVANATVAPPVREELKAPAPPALYKGFWMPCMFLQSDCQPMNKPASLKEAGANTAGIAPNVKINAEGKAQLDVPIDVAEQRLAELAKQYYAENISLMISIETQYVQNFNEGMQAGGPGAFPTGVADKAGYFDEYNAIVEKFAVMAEKYHVAIFSPMNEPDMKFGVAASSAWSQQVLPLVRKSYSGKILWKMGKPSSAGTSAIDFKGYDIIGLDMTPGGYGPEGSLSGYPALVSSTLSSAQGWAQRDGVAEVMFTEFGVWGGALSWNEADKAAAHAAVFQAGKGKVTGFFVLDPPPDLDRPITGTESYDVAKEWFTKKLG
jgi:hypothetical protein